MNAIEREDFQRCAVYLAQTDHLVKDKTKAYDVLCRFIPEYVALRRFWQEFKEAYHEAAIEHYRFLDDFPWKSIQIMEILANRKIPNPPDALAIATRIGVFK